MKRSSFFICLLCLILGLLGGTLIPVPWDKPAVPETPVLTHRLPSPEVSSSAAPGTQPTPPEVPFNRDDNIALLNAACSVVCALRQQDYGTLAAFTHPEKGVSFTPYSTVDPDSDLTFSQEQVIRLKQDSNVYRWGIVDGRGSPIDMTWFEYFNRYIFNVDYSQAPQIGVDQIMMRGNALENLTEAYPEGRFVDFCFPQLDQANEGLDWCSLRLVFESGQSGWYLVGVVHGEWTI